MLTCAVLGVPWTSQPYFILLIGVDASHLTIHSNLGTCNQNHLYKYKPYCNLKELLEIIRVGVWSGWSLKLSAWLHLAHARCVGGASAFSAILYFASRSGCVPCNHQFQSRQLQSKSFIKIQAKSQFKRAPGDHLRWRSERSISAAKHMVEPCSHTASGVS